MNAPRWILRTGIVAVAVGLALTAAQLRRPSNPPRVVTVAVAQRAIAPYTIVTSDMLAAGPTLAEAEARARGAFPLEAAGGLMTTERLAPGDLITTARALPAADVRFIEDLRLEVVSFAAGVDRLVGGRVRAGHRIHIYGTGRDDRNRTVTELVERAALVVQVNAAGQAVSDAFEAPDPRTGEVRRASGVRERSVTMVTVALAPPRVLHLIDALSARKLEPWVTLAAAGAFASPPPEAATPEPVRLPPEGVEFAPTVVTTPFATLSTLGGGGAAAPAP